MLHASPLKMKQPSREYDTILQVQPTEMSGVEISKINEDTSSTRKGPCSKGSTGTVEKYIQTDSPTPYLLALLHCPNVKVAEPPKRRRRGLENAQLNNQEK